MNIPTDQHGRPLPSDSPLRASDDEQVLRALIDRGFAERQPGELTPEQQAQLARAAASARANHARAEAQYDGWARATGTIRPDMEQAPSARLGWDKPPWQA
jgi:hypothetical protein